MGVVGMMRQWYSWDGGWVVKVGGDKENEARSEHICTSTATEGLLSVLRSEATPAGSGGE